MSGERGKFYPIDDRLRTVRLQNLEYIPRGYTRRLCVLHGRKSFQRHRAGQSGRVYSRLLFVGPGVSRVYGVSAMPLGVVPGAAQVLLTRPRRILIYANRHVAVLQSREGQDENGTILGL